MYNENQVPMKCVTEKSKQDQLESTEEITIITCLGRQPCVPFHRMLSRTVGKETIP